MDLKITDYLPPIEEIDESVLLDARTRIVNYLHTKKEFQTVDMRPNSVFGDLVLSPISHLLASFEIGSSRMFSDLDLSNVSAGTIYNCAFVKKYLNNFGQGQVYEYPSTGVIQLQFSTSKSKSLDVGTKFLAKGDLGEDYIFEMVGISDSLLLRPPEVKIDQNNPEERNLVRVAENVYVANVAVQGPAGVGVNDNTDIATDIPDSDLISAKAIGDFDRGTLPENIMELALKVQKTFYSASLNNRTGAVSFMLQTFPELRGVSPVVTGDSEMSRDMENVLGVKEGKMDLYFKSRSRYLTNEQELLLTYDSDTDQWVGSCDFIEPPTWIDSVRRASSLSDSVIVETHGISSDAKRFPKESAAYTKYEKLGLKVQDDLLSEDITPSNVINGEVDSFSDSNFSFNLQGYYTGNVFSKSYIKYLTLSFVEVDSSGGRVKAYLTDRDDNEVNEVYFVQSDIVNRGVMESSDKWDSMAKGVSMHIEGSAPFDSKMPLLVGTKLTMALTGRGGTFIIKYRYDPNFSIVQKLVDNNDVHPINSDVAVKNFLTCYVDSIRIDYRKKEGQNVDLIKAKEEIVNYVNRLVFPYVYEEYIIAEILLFYGAEGVSRITQNGQFFKSLADKYHVNGSVEDLHAPLSEDLQAPLSPGIGPRNVNYILDSSNVSFNAIII